MIAMLTPVISIIPSSSFAGTELAVLNTSRLLKSKGVENEIWTLSDSDDFDVMSETNCVTLRNFPISVRKPITSIISSLRLFRAARRYRKSHLFHAYLPKSFLLTYFLHLTAKIKFIAGIRGKMNYRGRLIELLLSKSLLASELIICNAQHLVLENSKRFRISEDRFFVLHNFVENRSRVIRKTGLKANIIVISNFLEYKGHHLLIDAIEISKTLPIVSLFGEGKMKSEIENRIRENGLQELIHFIPGTEMNRHLTQATFAVHPSETEGLSNAILEELSYGLPVIAFNVGGNSELIIDGYNGILLNERCPESLSAAIDFLSTNHEICKEYSENAYLTAIDFGPEKFLRKIVAVYEEIGKKAGVQNA